MACLDSVIFASMGSSGVMPMLLRVVRMSSPVMALSLALARFMLMPGMRFVLVPVLVLMVLVIMGLMAMTFAPC